MVEGAAGFLVAPTPGLAPVVLGVVDLDELMDALQGYEPLEGAAFGAVLGAEIGLELVGLVPAAGADLSPGFLAAGPVVAGFLAFGLEVAAAAVAPTAAAPSSFLSAF